MDEVASRLPSSTTSRRKDRPRASRVWAISRWRIGRFSSSLNAGMTMQSSGRAAGSEVTSGVEKGDELVVAGVGNQDCAVLSIVDEKGARGDGAGTGIHGLLDVREAAGP